MLGLLLIFRRDWIVPAATFIALSVGAYMVLKPQLRYPTQYSEIAFLWKLAPICLLTLPLLFAPLWVRVLVMMVIAAESFAQTFFNFIGRWPMMDSIYWVCGFSMGTTLIWFLLERLAMRTKDWSVQFGLIAIFTAAAVLIGMEASTKLPRIGGILAAIVSVTIVFSLIFRNPAIYLAGLMCWTVLLTMLLAICYFLNKTSPIHPLLILAAVPMLWIGQLPAIERLGGWKRFVTRIILVLIPLGTAIGMVLPEFLRNMKGELY